MHKDHTEKLRDSKLWKYIWLSISSTIKTVVVAAYETKNKGRYVERLPCSPVVKTSPSKAGSVGWSLIKELRFHMPQGQKKKKKASNRSNGVTNLINILKMVHIKKKNKKL